MNSISAVVITRNEEKKIARCLESLSWADEIIVIDGNSEDSTAKICKDPSKPWSKKINFLSKSWSGFRSQRNFAIDQAKNDWIFSIDSDEQCSPELAKKIKQLMTSKPSNLYYKVHRIEYFLGKAIRWGIWNPSYQDRLFNKKGVRYVNEIHEYPKYPSKPDRIHEPIYHFPSFAPDHFLEKMNKYTTIEARDRVVAGQRTNWFRMITSGPAMFLKNYFYYKAYRDGFHGFAISLLEGVSRTVRHVKIWQFQNEHKIDK